MSKLRGRHCRPPPSRPVLLILGEDEAVVESLKHLLLEMEVLAATTIEEAENLLARHREQVGAVAFNALPFDEEAVVHFLDRAEAGCVEETAFISLLPDKAEVAHAIKTDALAMRLPFDLEICRLGRLRQTLQELLGLVTQRPLLN